MSNAEDIVSRLNGDGNMPLAERALRTSHDQGIYIYNDVPATESMKGFALQQPGCVRVGQRSREGHMTLECAYFDDGTTLEWSYWARPTAYAPDGIHIMAYVASSFVKSEVRVPGPRQRGEY